MSAMVVASPQQARYAEAVDRESAHELLAARAARAETDAAAALAEEEARREAEVAAAAAKKEADRRARELERIEQRMRTGSGGSSRSSGGSRSSASPLDSFLRSAGTQLGREITRTIFGTRRR